MKKLLFTLVAMSLLFACNNDDSALETTLLGNWKLKEVLADPGDGSGTFLPVQSNKRITFEANGVITSNGSLCDMSTAADAPTSGTYSNTNFTFNSTDCSDPNYNYSFEQTGTVLIITYPCFEPCKAKYVKE